MRKIILQNRLCPGDLVMLSAAIRDLHRCHHAQYLTDVRTNCPDLWLHNPHLTRLPDGTPGVRTLDCHYPLIHHSNQSRLHFLWGFIEHVNEQLGTAVRLTEFKGDIHLSPEEQRRPSAVAGLTGADLPYWIVVAGGKYDYTIKWWHYRRYQEVVNAFRDRLLFVQVGVKGFYHPPLDGVIDLVGRTSMRDLIHLTHHAEGVLCPVTSLMHLAAAVPVRPNRPIHRPCVVVAGGREPASWEAYPHHRFLHTIGRLKCCATGGCWRSRTMPLHDGDEKDALDKRCLDVVDGLPHCMDLIGAEEVIACISGYVSEGKARYLRMEEAALAQPFLRRSQREMLLGCQKGMS